MRLAKKEISGRDQRVSRELIEDFNRNVRELTAYALRLSKVKAPSVRNVLVDPDKIRKDLDAHYVRVLTEIGENVVGAASFEADAKPSP